MTVQSAAGAMKIKAYKDLGGDPWVSATGGPGCFQNEAIEDLIAELAASIGKTATLNKTEKILTYADLGPGQKFKFKTGKTEWHEDAPIYLKINNEILFNVRTTDTLTVAGNDLTRVVVLV